MSYLIQTFMCNFLFVFVLLFIQVIYILKVFLAKCLWLIVMHKPNTTSTHTWFVYFSFVLYAFGTHGRKHKAQHPESPSSLFMRAAGARLHSAHHLSSCQSRPCLSYEESHTPSSFCLLNYLLAVGRTDSNSSNAVCSKWITSNAEQ